VCHTDLHYVRDDWRRTIFPLVPGHEIIGRVTRVGAKVSKLKISDYAGVGCMVDSCRHCASCSADLEQYCEEILRHNPAISNVIEFAREDWSAPWRLAPFVS
jgi:uncharacterized zinc-type alcohol dehydrogenase-like protein